MWNQVRGHRTALTGWDRTGRVPDHKTLTGITRGRAGDIRATSAGLCTVISNRTHHIPVIPPYQPVLLANSHFRACEWGRLFINQ